MDNFCLKEGSMLQIWKSLLFCVKRTIVERHMITQREALQFYNIQVCVL